MGQLSISDELLDRVAELARARRLPVDVQAEELLREAMDHRRDRTNLRVRFDKIAAMTPTGAQQTDSVLLLREDRDR